MFRYLQKLQKDLQKEIEAVEKESEKHIYTCLALSCEPFKRIFVLAVEQRIVMNHDIMKISKEERILVDGTVSGHVIETSAGALKCIIGKYVEPGKEVTLRVQNLNLVIILEKFSVYINDGMPKHATLQKYFMRCENIFFKNTNTALCHKEVRIGIQRGVMSAHLSLTSGQAETNKAFSEIDSLQDKSHVIESESGAYSLISSLARLSLDSPSIEPNQVCDVSPNFFNQSLNRTQKKAVLAIGNGKPYKIHGPPGTGKTTVLVEMIQHILANSQTVLICGPSNASIDNIIQKYIVIPDHIPFLRLGSSTKCFPGFKKYNLEHLCNEKSSFGDIEMISIENDLVKPKDENDMSNEKPGKRPQCSYRTSSSPNQQPSPWKNLSRHEIFRRSRVIFSTLFSSLKINGKTFDWVIIDEFCQCHEVEAILALVRGRNFVLVGDPYQLGPVSLTNMKNNMFEVMDTAQIMLDVQYRMNRLLIKFSNFYFYENKIISPKKSRFAFLGMSPLIFVNTDGCGAYEENRNESKLNKFEANLVVNLLNHFENRHMGMSIGVISPYSAQIDYIISNSRCKTSTRFQISTVDSFQGQERDIIILSFVRNNKSNQLGFLNDIHRTNVAITRCKTCLIVIGNGSMFKKHRFYAKYVAFLEREASVVDPKKLLQLLKR